MFATLLGILALFGVLAFVIAKVDGLAFLAPKSTRGVIGSAATYCAEGCRRADGRCPLTGTTERALNCPLWKFVEADVPTRVYGSPFAPAHAR
jgi:hypothetical protein